MERQRSGIREYAGRLKWEGVGDRVHKWTKGPLFVRWSYSDNGWMVELSRHGASGRVTIPVDGPYESLGDAKKSAASFVQPKRRRVEVGQTQVAA